MGGCRADGSSCLHDEVGRIGSHFFGQTSFATHAVVAARNAVKVGKDAPLALLGPLGCSIMTAAGAVFHSLDLGETESILIIGGRAVSLSAVMAAKVREATRIVVADLVTSRRTMALELRASDVNDVSAGDLVEQLKRMLPDGVSCVLDSSGAVPAIEAGINCLGFRGRLAMVVVPRSLDATSSLDIIQLLSKGILVCGVAKGDADPQTIQPLLVDLYREGRFPFDRLVTTYPLKQINQAIEDQHAGKCVEVVLTMR